jgi:hypothetical protein
MSTPANAEKERQRTLVREQRERERLEKEKERIARMEKLQKEQNSKPSGAVRKPTVAAASSAAGGANEDGTTSDSDLDAEETLANKKEYQQRIVQLWKDRAKKPQKPGSQIRFKTNFRNTILDVFRANGWREAESETDWDIFWTNKEWIRGIYDKIHLEQHQRVNHFRNFYELTRKDLLVKNLKRARRTLQKRGGGASSSTTTTTTTTTAGGKPIPGAAASVEEDVDSQFNFFPDTCQWKHNNRAKNL